MPTRRSRTADVRTSLIDAAETVLERDGETGLTVRAVAAEARVAPMGVYNHFDGGKDGLLLAVLQRAFDRLTRVSDWPADLAPEAGFRRVGLRYRAFALAAPVTYGLMFGRAWPDALHEELGRHAEPAFTALVEFVATAQAHDVVRAGPPEEYARALWSAVHGSVGLELASRMTPADGAAAYDDVLDLLVRGLAP